MGFYIYLAVWVVIILPAWAIYNRKIRISRFRAYYNRPCTGFLWWRAFPEQQKEHFRKFLRIIGKAFGLRPKNCCIFRPDDPLEKLYRDMNPTFWSLTYGDEDERLALYIEKEYQVKIYEVWTPGMSLSQLFAVCHANR